MRLPRLVVWVLTKNDHFYAVKRTQIKCIKNQRTGRINPFALAPLLLYIFFD